MPRALPTACTNEPRNCTICDQCTTRPMLYGPHACGSMEAIGDLALNLEVTVCGPIAPVTLFLLSLSSAIGIRTTSSSRWYVSPMPQKRFPQACGFQESSTRSSPDCVMRAPCISKCVQRALPAMKRHWRSSSFSEHRRSSGGLVPLSEGWSALPLHMGRACWWCQILKGSLGISHRPIKRTFCLRWEGSQDLQRDPSPREVTPVAGAGWEWSLLQLAWDFWACSTPSLLTRALPD